MTKIILKSNFQAHQKLVLILLFIVTFFIGSLVLLAFLLGPANKIGISVWDYVYLMLFPLSLYIMLLLLSKNGVVIDDNQLFTSKFIFKKPWYRKKVDMAGMTDISILKFRGKQKFMFASAADPDKAYSVGLQRAFLLNENHTKKKLLFEVNNEEMAQQAVHTIKEETDLNFTVYSPKIRSRRR
ncbi:hypothetical protein [Salinimicrobium gaetbulicola]|uniref:PH (Pleckstrin Homology) domain-containing protein n=1 Tax=Salinimicrobium gaetbulicola TaxID=999702 RepID=A0ABW3IHP6_9FLAO